VPGGAIRAGSDKLVQSLDEATRWNSRICQSRSPHRFLDQLFLSRFAPMADKPNISDKGGERTIFRSRFSVPIGVFYTSLCISFVGLVYSLSFSTGKYESSNLVTSHAIVIFLFLGYIILRDFRTLLYVTDKRIVQKSGILLRSTKTMDLEDVDIPLLQHSVTRFGAVINSVSGARISLWGVHNRYDAIRAILEVTGNKAPPKIERSATNRLLIYKVFLVVGCCVCLSLWSFVVAGTIVSDYGYIRAPLNIPFRVSIS